MRQLRALFAAVAFLTRIPAGAHDLDDLSRSTPYFPIVGLIVGGAGAVACVLGAMLWPTTLAIIVAVGITVLLTGAFHEDALADSFDGFGGGWNVEQVLAIMKDSRVGSYALVGVTLVLAAKIAALHSIAVTDGIGATAKSLVVGHVLGRWSSVPLIRYNAYVRSPSAVERPGTGRPFVDSVTVMHLVVATAVAALIVAAALGIRAIPAFTVAIVVTFLAQTYFRRRIGGITGDALGAANQLVELAVYLTLAAHLRT
jgi:adenosylcobinamide-GDP ribazoletransferase